MAIFGVCHNLKVQKEAKLRAEREKDKTDYDKILRLIEVEFIERKIHLQGVLQSSPLCP